jgi:hypothetical protein
MTREKLANTDLDDKTLCDGCKHRTKEIFEDPCRDCFDLIVRVRNYEKEETCGDCLFAVEIRGEGRQVWCRYSQFTQSKKGNCKAFKSKEKISKNRCETCRFAEPLVPGVSFQCEKTGTTNGFFGCEHYEEKNNGKDV